MLLCYHIKIEIYIFLIASKSEKKDYLLLDSFRFMEALPYLKKYLDFDIIFEGFRCYRDTSRPFLTDTYSIKLQRKRT